MNVIISKIDLKQMDEQVDIIKKSGMFSVNITYKKIKKPIPVFKNYILNLDLVCVRNYDGALYLNNLKEISYSIKKALSLPDNTTIILNHSYIGKENSISITLEVLMRDDYSRKLKIDEIVNE